MPLDALLQELGGESPAPGPAPVTVPPGGSLSRLLEEFSTPIDTRVQRVQALYRVAREQAAAAPRYGDGPMVGVGPAGTLQPYLPPEMFETFGGDPTPEDIDDLVRRQATGTGSKPQQGLLLAASRGLAGEGARAAGDLLRYAPGGDRLQPMLDGFAREVDAGGKDFAPPTLGEEITGAAGGTIPAVAQTILATRGMNAGAARVPGLARFTPESINRVNAAVAAGGLSLVSEARDPNISAADATTQAYLESAFTFLGGKTGVEALRRVSPTVRGLLADVFKEGAEEGSTSSTQALARALSQDPESALSLQGALQVGRQGAVGAGAGSISVPAFKAGEIGQIAVQGGRRIAEALRMAKPAAEQAAQPRATQTPDAPAPIATPPIQPPAATVQQPGEIAAEPTTAAPAPPAFAGGPIGGGILEQPGDLTSQDAAAALAAMFGQQQDQEATDVELDRWQGATADTTDRDALERELARTAPFQRGGPPPLAAAIPEAPVQGEPIAVPPEDAALAALPPNEKRKALKAQALAVRQAQQAEARPPVPAAAPEASFRPGDIVDLTAGKKGLRRAEVLSVADDGRLAVRFADDGRTVRGVPATRATPAKPSQEPIRAKPQPQPADVAPVPAPSASAPQAEQVAAPDRAPAPVAAGPAAGDRVGTGAAPAPVAPEPIKQAAPATGRQLVRYREFVAGLAPADRALVAQDIAEVGENPQDPYSAFQGIRQSLEMAKALQAKKPAPTPTVAEQAPQAPPLEAPPVIGDQTGRAGQAPAGASPAATPSTPSTIDAAAAEAKAEPTEAQREAGNYQKGHARIHGLDVTIENAKGSTRSGKDGSGKAWSVQMPAHYGYVKRTEGADGDQVDIYIGPNPEETSVYVVDQIDAESRAFDEHKAMIGFDSEASALAAYDAAFSDGRGPERRGAVTTLNAATFRRWLERGNTKRPMRYKGKGKSTKAEPIKFADREPRATSPMSLADLEDNSALTYDERTKDMVSPKVYRERRSMRVVEGKEGAADGDRLFAPERIPGDTDTLAGRDRTPGEPPEPAAVPRPGAERGIEAAIQWAIADRARVIQDARKRAERNDNPELAAEYRKDADEFAAVDPEELAAHMRAYPAHYLRAASGRGGSMHPVQVYRQRADLPPIEPRVQPSPMPPAKDGAAPDLRATMKALAADLKAAAPGAPTLDVDRGALPEGAAGEFDTRTGGITLAYHNDIDLVAHEVGHWAAETYRLLPGPADTAERAELAKFAVHGSPGKGNLAQREGMAEFFRAWMVNPADAELRAPAFAARVHAEVPADVLAALQKYGDSARTFLGAPALQQMAAAQQRTETSLAEQRALGRWWVPLFDGIRELLGRGTGDVKMRAGAIPSKWEAKAVTKAKFQIVDKEAPRLANYLLALQMAGKDPASMKPSEHWDFLRKGLRGVAGKLRDGISHQGLTNADGSVAIDEKTGERMALPWLLGPAVKRAKGDEGAMAAFLDRAHAYGSAQRTLELAERFTNKTEEEIDRFAEDQLKSAGENRYERERAADAVKQFAGERRQQLRAQLARLTAAGGGIRSATDVARAAIAEMEASPERKDADEYLRRYRAWADWNLAYAVAGEVMSPTQAQTIREANQYYIDWHRVFADEDGPVNLGEAVKGSSRTIHNPLASLLHSTWGTVTRADRNRADLAFIAPLRMKPADSAAGTSLAQLGRMISTEAGEEAMAKHSGYHSDAVGGKARVYRVQRLDQMVDEDGSPMFGPNGEPLQQVVVEHWVFDAATEAALEAMRMEGSNDAWAKVSQGLVNLQRLMITSAPSFRLKVPVRDNIDRILNSEVGSGVRDLGRKTLTDPLTGQELDLDQLYSATGASMAGWNRRTRDQALADVFAHVEDMRKQGWRVLTPAGAWRWWNAFGETTENLARKAEFSAAFRKGRTDLGYDQQDAALYAMTHARGLLDTAESGNLVGRLNRWFLFLNAAVKGVERMTKISRAAVTAYRRGDTATGNRLAGLMATRMAVWGTSLAAMRLMMLALMDDDEQEKFLSQPAWKRDFSIQIPDFGMGKIAIAKPYEWGFLGSGFERLADAAWSTGKAAEARAAGKTDAAKRWENHASRAGEGWAHSGMTALLPLKLDDALGGGLAPIAEVAFNRSLFTGGTVVPGHEAEKRLELRARASEASAVGRGLSAVLSPVLPDKFADPRAIDHLLRGYLGGWGAVATAKDGGEVMRRFTGYSGETSPYALRDVSWVLEWADREGQGSKKLFADLRGLARGVRTATDRQQAETALLRRAMLLRQRIESGAIKPGEVKAAK